MTPLPLRTILLGDARTLLATLPDASIDCVITSPPYFQLRDYGEPGQLGREADVTEWVSNLRAVCAELARVLVPAGSLWLNLGDSFSRHHRYGAPPKSLLLAPERLLLALAADGWLVRNKVIWAKTNPLPSSVTDRLSLTYEVVYFLVRARSYYFDLDAIRVPHRSSSAKRARPPRNLPSDWAGPLAGSRDGLRRPHASGTPGHPDGKNPGDVWSLATQGFAGAHFAVFPEALVERPLLATCPPAVCIACGRGWRQADVLARRSPCDCPDPIRPGRVLDPFCGTGTVGVVAQRLGRDWLGLELSPAYAAMATTRLGLAPPGKQRRAA